MTTAAPTTVTPSFFSAFLTDIENLGKKIVSWVETFASSPTGQTINTVLAGVAGEAAGYELISNITSTTKSAVAQDVVNIVLEAQALTSGTTPPTLSQMTTVFTGLKSNESTQLFVPLAQAAAQAIASFLGTNDGGDTSTGTWQPILKAFLQGVLNAATAEGGVVPASVPAATV